jgi:glycosyltransferase involved in cell wall biosynthesis
MRVWMPYIKVGSGVDVFTQRLAGALVEFGIEAIVQSFPKPFQYCPWALRSASMPAGTAAIIVNSWYAIGFARPGIPLVSVQHLCVHDPRYAPYRSKAQALFHRHFIYHAEAQGFAQCDVAVAVSEATEDATRNAFPRIFRTKPLISILNGIDTSFFTPGDEAMDMVESASWLRRLLFVGNPSRRKGSDLLIPIMEALGPDWTLDVIQGREEARDLQGHPQVNLLGRKDRAGVRQAMRESGLLLFPTRLEGLPLSAIEAMACGLPVAAANASSLPEIITDGLDGLLCRKDDPEDFARRIRAALGNPRAAMAMRHSARATAVGKFSEHQLARDWAAVISTLVNGASSGS